MCRPLEKELFYLLKLTHSLNTTTVIDWSFEPLTVAITRSHLSIQPEVINMQAPIALGLPS